jgi:phage-related protein
MMEDGAVEIAKSIRQLANDIAARLAEIKHEIDARLLERRKLARILAAVKMPSGRPAAVQKQRTRTMTPAQKKEVSVRMKRYWAKRRGELASKKK